MPLHSSSSLSVPKSAIINCHQIVTICSDGERYLSGHQQDQIQTIQQQNDVGASIVFDQNGRIMAVNHHDQVDTWIKKRFGSNCWDQVEVIDGWGCSVIPGLIDAHNHPIWFGDRIREFDQKLRGASYMDIHESGGGINQTVQETKRATEIQLLESLLARIKLMLTCGTTTLECKTGYGLEYECEKKMLRVIQQARKLTPVHLVSTFLGAHSIPCGMTPDEGVQNVCKMMSQLAQEDPDLGIEFIDVFCEKGVYDQEKTEQILKHALTIFPRSKLAFHGDELSDQNSGSLAARLGARSVSHLEYLNPSGIEAMASKHVAAIINPTTCYLLKLPKPPVRQMIKTGVPVVVATDYNPNAMCYSLPMAMNLAAVHLGMTLNECLVGATLNAAYALDRSHECGSLEVGKRGDCLILNHSDWRHLIGQFGNTAPLIRTVIINGNRVL